MKILSLILDGNGRLSAELCLSPDLRRREIVAATGGGELIWCGLAAHRQKPAEVLEELRCYIDARGLDRWDRLSLRNAIRKAYAVTVLLPAIERAKVSARRIVNSPVCRLRNALALARRTP